MFTDPATKNSADLAIYAASAWNSGWGYVWGTFGQVLTPELMETLYGVRAEFLQTASGPVLAPCVEDW